MLARITPKDVPIAKSSFRSLAINLVADVSLYKNKLDVEFVVFVSYHNEPFTVPVNVLVAEIVCEEPIVK